MKNTNNFNVVSFIRNETKMTDIPVWFKHPGETMMRPAVYHGFSGTWPTAKIVSPWNENELLHCYWDSDKKRYACDRWPSENVSWMN